MSLLQFQLGVAECNAFNSEFLAVTKQLYESYFLSVCPSVRLSIHLSICPSVHLSHLFHYVPIIVSSWNFQGVITNDESKVHAKGQGQRLKVKVTKVKTQLNLFWTVTKVWIHIWWWNDAQSLCCQKRCLIVFQSQLSAFDVTGLKKIVIFDQNWAFLDCNSSFNSPMATKWCTKH